MLPGVSEHLAAAITSRIVGKQRIVFVVGMAAWSYGLDDGPARDATIAMLLRAGIKSARIEPLLDVSHGWVHVVTEKLREGGIEAVLTHKKTGRAAKIQGARLKRLLKKAQTALSIRQLAAEMGEPKSVVARELKRAGIKIVRPASQLSLDDVAVPPSVDATSTPTPRESTDESASESAPEVVPQVRDEDDRELAPGVIIEPGPAAHPTPYAGTLLLCAALSATGAIAAVKEAGVRRPKSAIYPAEQVIVAMMAAWGAGFASLESMHERDAHGLGVVLGLERSPSVRTLNRAVAQMRDGFDPTVLGAALMRGVHRAAKEINAGTEGEEGEPRRAIEARWFGVDGHFKAYSGDAPIDKGWDSKRRMATKGLSDVIVHDVRGWTWSVAPTGTADGLRMHLLDGGRALRAGLGDTQPIVLCSDRGGFDFEVLDALDREGFYYVMYVPASVKLPELRPIAPPRDGVDETPWSHPRLTHRARLLVQRDDAALIPIATNLPTLVPAEIVHEGLRACRGAQENGFKAARSFAHVDRLVDRGVASVEPDGRKVRNPAYEVVRADLERAALEDISDEALDDLVEDLATTPPKIARMLLDPDAQRAVLRTRNRLLLQPLKYATDTARRWLLEALGDALAPSDHADDRDAIARTLLALLKAPGTVRFEADSVHVTLVMPLPPAPHARIDAALRAPQMRRLHTLDGRRLRFELAPRVTRRTLAERRGA